MAEPNTIAKLQIYGHGLIEIDKSSFNNWPQKFKMFMSYKIFMNSINCPVSSH